MKTHLLVIVASVFTMACSRQSGESGKQLEQHDSMCWRSISTSEAPPARYDHAMAVDDSSWKLYLFGGRGGDRFFNDLWVFSPDGQVWEKIETDSAPPARSGHSLVFDSASKRLVMFGGFSYNNSGEVTFHSDLWTYSTEQGWSREFFENGPSGRAWHAALATRDAMVIFGGFEGEPNYYVRDIWSLDFSELVFKRVATDGGPLMAGSPALLDMGGPSSLLAFGPSALQVFGRVGMPVPEHAGLWSLQVELDAWSLVDTGNVPDADFTLANTDSTGKALLVGRGPEEDDEDREWTFWTINAGDDEWQDFEVVNGPATVHRLVCASEPGRPGNWICFGGAHRQLVGGETWSLSPCEGPDGE